MNRIELNPSMFENLVHSRNSLLSYNNISTAVCEYHNIF